jgi:hypothetical protein
MRGTGKCQDGQHLAPTLDICLDLTLSTQVHHNCHRTWSILTHHNWRHEAPIPYAQLHLTAVQLLAGTRRGQGAGKTSATCITCASAPRMRGESPPCPPEAPVRHQPHHTCFQQALGAVRLVPTQEQQTHIVHAAIALPRQRTHADTIIPKPKTASRPQPALRRLQTTLPAYDKGYVLHPRRETPLANPHCALNGRAQASQPSPQTPHKAATPAAATS